MLCEPYVYVTGFLLTMIDDTEWYHICLCLHDNKTYNISKILFIFRSLQW